MAMFDREQLYTDMNQPRTKSLFVDFGTDPYNILTLGTFNKSYPCLRTLYVNYCTEDPSEYEFAEAILGEWAFWSKLKEATFMKERLKEWQHEAAVKRKSMAFKSIIKEVKDEGRNGYHAAKYLVDEPWIGKGKAEKSASQKSASEAATGENVTDIAKFIKSRNL